MSEIKLKVGQKVKFRNGEQGVVTEELDDEYGYRFTVKSLEDGEGASHTADGYFYSHKSESEFDVVEILEEPRNEEMKENKGKFELSITVNDINNSCKNDKFYCLGFSELIEEVNKLTLNKICLTKFVSEQEVFEGKGDTLKLSKIIKINGKELGKVTIKITQLED